MPLRVVAEFVLLAALWGGSFLFMRVAGPEFGAMPLAAIRAAGAAAMLLPLLALRGGFGALRQRTLAIGWLGVTNSALPFACYAAAALAITSGLLSIFNATTPIWGALIAWAWLGERLDRGRIAGVAIAFAGIMWLVGDHASLRPGANGVSPTIAIVLCFVATAGYGYSAALTRRTLGGVPSLALAAGSQVSAALVLAIPAIHGWPATPPSAVAWGAALALAFACTGAAYALYFRLIARLGPTRAVSVTFLIPPFAVLWGSVFLDEPFGPGLAAGCAVIVLGTSLATGLWRPRLLVRRSAA